MRYFVYFDVSGSIPEELLNRYLFESEWRRSAYKHDEWLEFGFAVDVHLFEDCISGKIPLGVGGTDSESVWQHFVDNADEADGFLLFTDGFMPPIRLIPGSGPVEMIVLKEEDL